MTSTTATRATALVLLTALLAIGAWSPANADGARQQVNGRVIVPTGDWGNCIIFEATMMWATNQPGTFGFRFQVDPKTYRLPFVLTPNAPADLYVYFLDGGLLPDERGLAAKRGIVPAGAETAYVCMFAGGATSFTYVAG